METTPLKRRPKRAVTLVAVLLMILMMPHLVAAPSLSSIPAAISFVYFTLTIGLPIMIINYALRHALDLLIPIMTLQVVSRPYFISASTFYPSLMVVVLQAIMPLIVLGVLYSAIKLIFSSANPGERSEAKNQLQAMLIGMIVIPVSPYLYQILVDLAYNLMVLLIGGHAIPIPPATSSPYQQGVLQQILGPHSFGTAVYAPFTGIGASPNFLFILVCACISYILALSVLFFRHIIVVTFAVLMPLICFLYLFDFTKTVGRKFLKYAITWAFVPPVMAMWIVVIAALVSSTGVGTSSASIVSLDPNTGTVMVCAFFALMAITPLQITGALEAMGSVLSGAGQMTGGWHGAALTAAGSMLQAKSPEGLVMAGMMVAATGAFKAAGAAVNPLTSAAKALKGGGVGGLMGGLIMRGGAFMGSKMGGAGKSIGSAMGSIGGAVGQAVSAGGSAIGSGMMAGGKGMMKGGAALSATGLGAIIGVPLMIAGAATVAAGAGVKVGSKVAGAAIKVGSKISGKVASVAINVGAKGAKIAGKAIKMGAKVAGKVKRAGASFGRKLLSPGKSLVNAGRNLSSRGGFKKAFGKSISAAGHVMRTPAYLAKGAAKAGKAGFSLLDKAKGKIADMKFTKNGRSLRERFGAKAGQMKKDALKAGMSVLSGYGSKLSGLYTDGQDDQSTLSKAGKLAGAAKIGDLGKGLKSKIGGLGKKISNSKLGKVLGWKIPGTGFLTKESQAKRRAAIKNTVGKPIGAIKTAYQDATKAIGASVGKGADILGGWVGNTPESVSAAEANLERLAKAGGVTGAFAALARNTAHAAAGMSLKGVMKNAMLFGAAKILLGAALTVGGGGIPIALGVGLGAYAATKALNAVGAGKIFKASKFGKAVVDGFRTVGGKDLGAAFANMRGAGAGVKLGFALGKVAGVGADLTKWALKAGISKLPAFAAATAATGGLNLIGASLRGAVGAVKGAMRLGKGLKEFKSEYKGTSTMGAAGLTGAAAKSPEGKLSAGMRSTFGTQAGRRLEWQTRQAVGAELGKDATKVTNADIANAKSSTLEGAVKSATPATRKEALKRASDQLSDNKEFQSANQDGKHKMVSDQADALMKGPSPEDAASMANGIHHAAANADLTQPNMARDLGITHQQAENLQKNGLDTYVGVANASPTALIGAGIAADAVSKVTENASKAYDAMVNGGAGAVGAAMAKEKESKSEPGSEGKERKDEAGERRGEKAEKDTKDTAEGRRQMLSEKERYDQLKSIMSNVGGRRQRTKSNTQHLEEMLDDKDETPVQR